MKLGFTGTREGMTAKQYATVVRLIGEIKPDWVLHGDCCGADTQFHEIVMKIRGGILGTSIPRIHIFPSTSKTRQYNEPFEVCDPPKPPLERDGIIARTCDKLIATPKEDEEILRSGTWTTVRYARLANKVIYIVLPSGEIR